MILRIYPILEIENFSFYFNITLFLQTNTDSRLIFAKKIDLELKMTWIVNYIMKNQHFQIFKISKHYFLNF